MGATSARTGLSRRSSFGTTRPLSTCTAIRIAHNRRYVQRAANVGERLPVFAEFTLCDPVSDVQVKWFRAVKVPDHSGWQPCGSVRTEKRSAALTPWLLVRLICSPCAHVARSMASYRVRRWRPRRAAGVTNLSSSPGEAYLTPRAASLLGQVERCGALCAESHQNAHSATAQRLNLRPVDQ